MSPHANPLGSAVGLSAPHALEAKRLDFLNRHWYSLIEGQPLHQWLDRYGEFRPRFNSRIEALDYAINLHENAERHIR